MIAVADDHGVPARRVEVDVDAMCSACFDGLPGIMDAPATAGA